MSGATVECTKRKARNCPVKVVFVPVATTERQFLTKSCLVDLDDLHASSFKVKNFILDSKSDLKSRILDRDVFTWNDQLRMVTGPVNIPLTGLFVRLCA